MCTTHLADLDGLARVRKQRRSTKVVASQFNKFTLGHDVHFPSGGKRGFGI
jgi:hypothetical protein